MSAPQTVTLRVSDATPAKDSVAWINAIKQLTGFFWELSVVPAPEQYAAFAALERAGGNRSFGLRHVYGEPRAQDVEWWVKLQPSRLQLSKQAYEAAGVAQSLSRLRGEVIVETFGLSP